MILFVISFFPCDVVCLRLDAQQCKELITFFRVVVSDSALSVYMRA